MEQNFFFFFALWGTKSYGYAAIFELAGAAVLLLRC